MASSALCGLGVYVEVERGSKSQKQKKTWSHEIRDCADASGNSNSQSIHLRGAGCWKPQTRSEYLKMKIKDLHDYHLSCAYRSVSKKPVDLQSPGSHTTGRALNLLHIIFPTSHILLIAAYASLQPASSPRPLSGQMRCLVLERLVYPDSCVCRHSSGIPSCCRCERDSG